jgi:hypothetical protein
MTPDEATAREIVREYIREWDDNTIEGEWLAERIAAALRVQRDALYKMMQKEERRISQIAGQALGYPWFKDDLVNFPNATADDGVCIGDHVAATIVQELANQYRSQRPRWSKKKPAQAGWYWLRSAVQSTTGESHYVEPVWICDWRGDGELHACIGDDLIGPIQEIDGEWASVLLPEEGGA